MDFQILNLRVKLPQNRTKKIVIFYIYEKWLYISKFKPPISQKLKENFQIRF